MLTIEWAYLYHRGPVSGRGTWNEDTPVWFMITNDDYLHNDEPQYLTLESSGLSLNEMIEKVNTHTHTTHQTRERSYHLYRLTPEQVAHLAEERERYCTITGWNRGYSLRFTPPPLPTVTAIDPRTQADADHTVEINPLGMITPIIAHYNIDLSSLGSSLDTPWMTITRKEIANYYPSS